MRYAATITLVLTLAGTLPAYAVEKPVWQAAGTTCAPSHGTNEAEAYITTAGVIKLKEGAVGKASFFCPVHTPLEDGFYRLRAFYQPNNTPSPLRKFDVALRRRTLTEMEGNFSHVANMLVAGQVGRGFSNFPRGTLHSRSQKLEFDLGENVYWVQITLNDPGQSIEGVVLYRSNERKPEQPPQPRPSCSLGDNNCCNPQEQIIGIDDETGEIITKPQCSSCADTRFGCPVLENDQLDQLLDSLQ